MIDRQTLRLARFEILAMDTATRVAVSSQIARGSSCNDPSKLRNHSGHCPRAEAMAKAAGLSVEILDEKKLSNLKMGALLSVAQGSAEPPRMIVDYYTPENVNAAAPVWPGRESHHI